MAVILGLFDFGQDERLEDEAAVVRAVDRATDWILDCGYLEVWKTSKFSDVSLRQWLAFTPLDLVQAHLKIDRSVLANIPTHKTPVVPA